jgi:hypothetical protein
MLTPEEQVSGPLQQLPTPSRRTLSRMFQLLLLLLLLGHCSLLLLLLLLPLRLLRTLQRAGMGGKSVLDPTFLRRNGGGVTLRGGGQEGRGVQRAGMGGKSVLDPAT